MQLRTSNEVSVEYKMWFLDVFRPPFKIMDQSNIGSTSILPNIASRCNQTFSGTKTINDHSLFIPQSFLCLDVPQETVYRSTIACQNGSLVSG